MQKKYEQMKKTKKTRAGGERNLNKEEKEKLKIKE